MSDRRSGSRKRTKVLQEGSWDCSVCTFANSPEAFKCSICDTRKGTSTRKPKVSQQIVAQQEATRLVAQMPHSPSCHSPREDNHESKSKHANESKTTKMKLKEFDRNQPSTLAVTVNNVTFMFTEYRHKDVSENDKKGKKEKPH